MITVLLSTYNGERYLREQIESILRQEGVEVHLFVRDDGSTDSTLSILDEYSQRGLLTYYTSPNLGAAKSFLQLLTDAPESDFYAFADQDDYWQSDKLYAAVSRLSATEPSLYFSRTTLTDKELNPTGCVEIDPYLTFGESLVYEFVAGCTIVMSKPLRDVIVTYRPDYLPMHDVWVYSIALGLGAKVVFDKQSHILYRQHGNNTTGQGQGVIHDCKQRMRRILRKENSRYRRACELQKGFAHLFKAENAQLLTDFIKAKHSLPRRLALGCRRQLACANSTTAFLFRVALLANTY